MSAKYLEDCEARMRANTVQEKFTHYTDFATFLEVDTPAQAITVPIAQDFAARIHDIKDSKGANRYMRNLKALWNWFIRRGEIGENPWSAVQPYPEERYVKYVPPVEDVAQVRLNATPEERAIIDTLYYTAARLSEVLGLTWEDVNLSQKTITLWTRKRRGGDLQADTIAIPDALASTLKRLWRLREKESPYVLTNPETGQPYHRNSRFIKYLFERVCKRVEVKRFTAHAIRHHVASIMADSGKVSTRNIKSLLRHQRESTTENYIREITVDRSTANFFELGTHEGTHEAKKKAVSDKD